MLKSRDCAAQTRPFFGDLNKKSNDLITKDFGTDNKVKVETAAADVKYTANLTKKEKDGSVNGDLSMKVKAYGHEVTGKLDTAGLLSVDVNLIKLVPQVPDLKLIIKANSNSALEGKFEYKACSWASMTGGVNLAKGPTLASSLVVGHDIFNLGVDVAYNLENGAILKDDLALGLAMDNSTAVVVAKDQFKIINASYHVNVNSFGDAAEVGAELALNRASGKVNLTVGGKTKYNGATVKAKLNNAGQLGLSYGIKLNKNTSVTAGAQIDTSALGKDAHKVGLSLVLQD